MAEAPATRDATSAANPGGRASLDQDDQLRADTYRLLGRLLAAPPDEELLALLGKAPVTRDNNLLAVAWRMLAGAAARTSAAQVADEYNALFIGLGRGELVPYGSWYMTGFLMEQPLAKLRSDLKKLGFERQDGVHEPEDHAAALCETMALLGGEDETATLETQATFFAAHMEPWMARFFRDMQGSASASFYRAVGQLGEQFLETDQRYLEMVERKAERPTGSPHTGNS